MSSLIAHLLLTVVLFHQFVVATLHWAGQRGRGSACCNVSCSSKPMIVEFVLSFRAPYVSLSLLWVCERAQAAACFYEWRQWGCNRLKGLYILNLIIFPCGWGTFLLCQSCLKTSLHPRRHSTHLQLKLYELSISFDFSLVNLPFWLWGTENYVYMYFCIASFH